MFKNVKIVARKEKYEFEDGNVVDCLKFVMYLDCFKIELSPSKNYKELLKQILRFDEMNYNEDYLVSVIGGNK